MPKMYISRSIFINKKASDIFPLLNNFDHWSIWSPWLIMEKGVKVNVAPDKKYYDWEGDLTGAGNMQVTNEVQNEKIDYNLTFLKPWKSHAKIGFILQPQGEGTKITWTMDSSLPFFLFWMKKMTENFIGMDYNRGLNMLKDLAEQGKVPSSLDFKGNSEYEGCNYIGLKANCTFDNIKESHKGNFEKMMSYISEKKDLISANPFTIYHKWDINKQLCTYTACLPVKEIPSELPNDMVTGTYPKTKTHCVHHIGPYRHIGNAWSSLYSRLRAKRFKLNKSIDPIEIYLNSPKDTPENDLQTEIHFPIK